MKLTRLLRNPLFLPSPLRFWAHDRWIISHAPPPPEQLFAWGSTALPAQKGLSWRSAPLLSRELQPVVFLLCAFLLCQRPNWLSPSLLWSDTVLSGLFTCNFFSCHSFFICYKLSISGPINKQGTCAIRVRLLITISSCVQLLNIGLS